MSDTVNGSTSNFGFMDVALNGGNDVYTTRCAEIQTRAKNAESNIKTDPRIAGFYARNALELMVETVFDIDNWLTRPRHDATLMSLIHDKDFKQNLETHLFPKLKLVIQVGNEAVHSKTTLPQRDALQAVKELHHVLYWFIRTYTPNLDRKQFVVQPFDEALIPQQVSIDATVATKALSSIKRVKELEKQLEQDDKVEREAYLQQIKENETLKAANQALLEQIEQAKQSAEKVTDAHDYNEEETRTYLIDVLLHEAGWKLEHKRDREYPVSGMPISKVNPKGNGFVDYVLWGDDGTALAVVEAKRTHRRAEDGQQQAKLYADCIEKQCGVRPVIFYTNGYDTHLWDDHFYPPRQVQGFYTKAELELMVKRRTDRKSFFESGMPNSNLVINNEITNRHYQKSAITKLLQDFELEHERKGLFVMATGTGKTRTVISLVDLLVKNDWVKNVLFLADRNALLTQAKKNFVKLLPRVSCSILDSGQSKNNIDSRLYFSTYPTMKNLLDRGADERPFGVGHFDLIIVDEAHRSVYSKYRQIFEYFDGFLVGLTATPKDEVEKDTYGIFELQKGMPTYAYEDDKAYDQGYLVPPTKISVATKFLREGVKYKDLSDEEQEEWENKAELEDRDEVLPSEVNKFLFNEDTAEKMFAQLMSKDDRGGIHVEGGDVIGKTIVFAANNDHAVFLEKMFNKNYPKWAGKLARVITFKETYAQSLIDEFGGDENKIDEFDPKNPTCRIAISVDMLDTGIDVPEVVNLVFFKVIRSKVKFTQMIGRGTRLCKDLFGPNDDKKTFKVFDYCQNFEYFDANPEGIAVGVAKPVTQQVFEKRVLLSTLLNDQLNNEEFREQNPEDCQRYTELNRYQLDMLHHLVSGMNLDNFIVRPKRQAVEPFLERDYWDNIDDTKFTELESQISALPTEAEAFNSDEQLNHLSHRFDSLVLTMQLDLLEKGMLSETSRGRVVEFAEQLEAKSTIPAVQAQLQLIQDIQTQEFWQDIHLVTLEELRRKLRNLMFALDKDKKEMVYTNFEDEVQGVHDVTNVYKNPSVDLAQYRKKIELYIQDHQDQLTIQKLKRNKSITQADLDVLEGLLLDASGMSDVEAYREKILQEKPLGTFIRELIGLDMNAAKEAFSSFLDEESYNAEQIQFVDQVIDYLVNNGILDMSQLFEPPFTDNHGESAYGFFDEGTVVELFGVIRKVNANAVVEESKSA
ncbi:DEAD/DEAH box helicase family protein [Vibrio sp. 10N.261.46.E12]|uniref:DEAD/DEAH box helicase family protein n=1 Tax=unclassified Vibrio TaxID=2614977 RepID=UPI0009786E28|nr:MULTISPECIES: DEAD/DEAH box helicase family protein [unclassified Vibrio]OMO36431.1 restriction endonuclease subunit R [Vibrio sp. 10N.261.45.E1]PMJ22097.1 restriction endonuclease subunit R [Vibrio sp. 10N.286.45.B6]PML97459.1 restriction endonuclease subunit R [Vibrio sp. 10N.261.49.E11]PMM76591.1 restriction endonuclease subunit R [Vibrio sp. 10N.261.46.F12]PMM86915.1 restriction endonuclease subunit R [Vibrio sp. 10N.261.46.E8]